MHEWARGTLIVVGLSLGLAALVERGEADCGFKVQRLTLELSSLESLDGAVEVDLAEEKERLATESHLVGDWEHDYDPKEKIMWHGAWTDADYVALISEDSQ